jgi:hypothetical protein
MLSLDLLPCAPPCVDDHTFSASELEFIQPEAGCANVNDAER